ncbi:profilin-like protein [NY_014 poxvirus]|uniref:profilin-like protein n=1 Tax=NY_014 poxvirus TaxID=2025360 RepID=UPI000B99F652|nr:profilin-like protein [NY_014 poxvirus]AST09553.1 profilin-like protein [NY_014 poxvirus]
MAEWNKFIEEVVKTNKFEDAAIVDYKTRKTIMAAIPNRTFSKISPGEVNILILHRNILKIRLGREFMIVYKNSLMDENNYTMELVTAYPPVSPIAICRTHTALIFLMGKPTTSRKEVYATCKRFAAKVRKTGN